MKHNIKNHLKYCILLFGISITLHNCQKVDENQIVNIKTEPSFSVTIVKGNDHFATSNPKIYNKLKQTSQSNILSKETEYSEDYDFYFNLNDIQIIEKAYYIQYTVVVERDIESNDLLNYILLIYNNGDEDQYLVTYPRVET